MGVATATTEANLSAINESLLQLSATLGRMAARQDQMLVDWKKRTAALAPIATTTPKFVSGPVLEQQMTKPSSPSLFSANQVVGSGAPHMGAATPTRCSTKGPGHYSANGRAKLVFPASDTAHIPDTTSFGAGSCTLQGMCGTGMNSPTSCSTNVRTWFPDVPGTRTHDADSNMPRVPRCQVGEQPAVRRPLLPQISFPRFNGDNPRLWRDNCLEYFKIFNINECMWVTAATLHMEGAAAQWYKAYKLRESVGDWSQFINAVETKFDAWDAETHDTKEQQLMLCEATLGNVTHMVEPFSEDSNGVQTHVGELSLFTELNVDSEDEVFKDSPLKDMVWDEEFADCVVTHIGGSSLFLEHNMDTHHELAAKIAKPTRLEHGVDGVGQVLPVLPAEESMLQVLLKEVRQQGNINATLSLSWDPGKQEAVMKRLFGLRSHAETCVGQCNFCVNRRSKKDANTVQLATDRFLIKVLSWRRSGFSPGYYERPQLEIMPSWRRGGFSPGGLVLAFVSDIRMFHYFWIKVSVWDFSVTVNGALLSVTFSMKVLHIFLAQFEKRPVEQLVFCKCVFNGAKAAMLILLTLTLKDVWECTSNHMVQVTTYVAYLCRMELRLTDQSARTFQDHFSFVDKPIAAARFALEVKAEKGQCVNISQCIRKFGHTRFRSHWDPGGSRFACSDNTAGILTVELFVKWEPEVMRNLLRGLMTSLDERSDMLSLIEIATTAYECESQLHHKQWDPGILEAPSWHDGYCVLTKKMWELSLEDLYSIQSYKQFIDNLQQDGRRLACCHWVIHVATKFIYKSQSSMVLRPERPLLGVKQCFLGAVMSCPCITYTGLSRHGLWAVCLGYGLSGLWASYLA